MRGKGGEILLDGLVIAHIRQDGVEYGQLGAISRNRNTGLRHQREQAGGL